jgi:hypothetical protein
VLIDRVSGRPDFESSASADLKLVAVSADQISRALYSTSVAGAKRHTAKHSKEVTTTFQSAAEKRAVTSSYCE